APGRLALHPAITINQRFLRLDSHGIGDTSSRGKIQLPVRKKIVKCAKKHGILPGIFMQILGKNFR
ncbi:MAG: hypothetical protein OXL95_07255, partial [Nitrospira sp.]|nr:hypothetical protein [Nitrospira sp.]MDE0487452.1 hypothetical protein [Nitrospira sp.]